MKKRKLPTSQFERQNFLNTFININILKKILKTLLFVLVPLIILIFRVMPGICLISDQLTTNYTPSDAETNYLTALNVFRTGALYKDFSIVYPPGRFLALAGLFKIFSPSLPLARFYFNFFAPWLFPTFLFFLSYRVFVILLTKQKSNHSKLKSYILTILTTLISIYFVHSAQETHILIALFFLIDLSLWQNKKLKHFLLGLILGMVYLFRLDAGLLLTISLIFTRFKKTLNYVIPGFLLVWLPVLILIITQGSFKNFIYDVFVLGLWVQPRMMSQPIPPKPLGLVFLATLIFLLGSTLALSSKYSSLTSLSLFSLLSFTAALGRSDGGHLWYGLIWLPIFISYFISQLNFKKFWNKKVWCIFPIGIVLTLMAKLILFIKSPIIFIIICLLAFGLIKKVKIKPAYLLLSAGLTALFFFHSIKYLRLRFLPAWPPKTCSFSWKTLQPAENKIAGLIFKPSIQQTLKQIKNDINAEQDEFLFIFPDHVLFYEYFQMKNPTRYFYFTGERTKKTELDIISDLEKTKTKYFLIFPKKSKERGDKVWQWLIAKTQINSTYQLDNIAVELRKLK